MYAFSMIGTQSSSWCLLPFVMEQSKLPCESIGNRSSTTTCRATPFNQSLTMYFPSGLYIGWPCLSCGWMMDVINRWRLMPVAQMHRLAMKEQSVTYCCRIVYGEIWRIIVGGCCFVPCRCRIATISCGRAHPWNLFPCFGESLSTPAGSEYGFLVPFAMLACADLSSFSASVFDQGKNTPDAIKDDRFSTSISRCDNDDALLVESSSAAFCSRVAECPFNLSVSTRSMAPSKRPTSRCFIIASPLSSKSRMMAK
mmetsp:Transcript_6882/g.20198  ORF Transcript_6882/g.20198 Transcript_6882/m.20198 type:complete len:255 (-) Transcript_6882:586-1350(-)